MTKVNAYRPGNWNVDPSRTEIPIAEAFRIPNQLSSINITTGNGIEIISVGDLFPSREGGRLILRVRWNGQDPGVIYLENGKVYGHHGLYFWKETWMESFQTGAHWARGGAMIAKMQVELCMGIMAGAGGKFAHYALTAVNVVELTSQHDILKLMNYIPVVISARSAMKRIAPRLYDKLFSVFIDKILDNAAESVISSATAYLVGRIIGRAGLHIPFEFEKTASKIKDIAKFISTYIAIRIASAAGEAAKDLKSLATDWQTTIRDVGVEITAAEALEIASEIEKNKEELLKILASLSEPSSSANQSYRYEREIGNRI